MVKRSGRDGNPLELVSARGHERAGKSEALVRNIREHPMDTLLERGTIEGYQHQACEYFLRDWELSQIGLVRATSYEMRVDGGRAGDLTAAQADAVARLNRAIRSLSRVDGVIVSALVVDRLTLAMIGARMRSAGLKWPPQRYGADRVGEALDELAAHYGLRTHRSSTSMLLDVAPTMA